MTIAIINNKRKTLPERITNCYSSIATALSAARQGQGYCQAAETSRAINLLVFSMKMTIINVQEIT
jgi:hypothetical protein